MTTTANETTYRYFRYYLYTTTLDTRAQHAFAIEPQMVTKQVVATTNYVDKKHLTSIVHKMTVTANETTYFRYYLYSIVSLLGTG